MVRAGPDYFAKLRMNNILSEAFVQHHFEESSKRLFMPLARLANRRTLNDLTFHDVALYAHLVDILGFFVRQHAYRGRVVIHNESLAPRIAQLLTVPQKHLKLTALKFFRGLVGVQDTFFQALLTHNTNIFGLILDIVTETMPRDNLLNSACLELFEFIRRENIKPFVVHVVETYRERLLSITYVDTFHDLVNRYEQMQGYGAEAMAAVVAEEEQAQAQAQAARMQRVQVNGQHWQGIREMEAAEEAYFSTEDDEELAANPVFGYAEWCCTSTLQAIG
ncbi:Platinum sensitivity protein [Elasticomyces elasticus]|nr:Platinum sensitivity protein [Elasticomyces elasticus]